MLHLKFFAYDADKRPADLTDKVQRRAYDSAPRIKKSPLSSDIRYYTVLYSKMPWF